MQVKSLDLPFGNTRAAAMIRECVTVLGASILIALFGPIAIHLPFTPVPIATQAQVILFLSVILGSRRAVLAVSAFLFQGMIGLPVFAGGSGSIMAFLGPTGGYLIGYLVAAWVTGAISERLLSHRTPLKAFMSMGLGNLVIFLFGLPWLSRYIGWENAFMLGFLPFIIGDLFKLFIATLALKRFNQ